MMPVKDSVRETPAIKRLLQTKEFEQTLQPRRHNDSHNKMVTYATNSLTMFLTSSAQYLLMEPCEWYPW